MLKVNRCLGRNFFRSISLFAIISCILFSIPAFSEEATLTQAEKDYAQANELWKLKKYDEAKPLYQSVSQSPDSDWAIKGYGGVACCEYKLGNDTAGDEAIEVIKKDYSTNEYLDNHIYEVATICWNSKKYAKARDIFQYQSENSSDIERAIYAQASVADCEIRLGNDSAAEQAINTLKTDYSQHPKLCTNIDELANAYRKFQKFDKAKDLYQYVSENSPDSNLVLKGRAGVIGCEIRLGNYSAAEQAINTLKTDYSQHPDLGGELYGLGNQYLVVGKYEEAKQLFNYIAEQLPDSSFAFRGQRQAISADIKSGNYTAAEAGIDELIADFSENPSLYGTLNGLGNEYTAVKEYERARWLYQNVVDNCSDRKVVLQGHVGVGLSQIYLDEPQVGAVVDTLIANFNDVPRVDWGVFVIGEEYYKLASAMEKQGLESLANNNYLKAINVWKRIKDNLGESGHAAHAWYYSAVAYRQIGDNEKAIEYFNRVVDDYPEFDKAWAAHTAVANIYYKLYQTKVMPKKQAAAEIQSIYDAILGKWPDCPSLPMLRTFLSHVK